MTTFAQVAAMQGRTLMVLMDVSFDKFATVTYRWATHAGVVNGNRYDKRILAVGTLKRGFGQDHLPTASTLSVQLSNVDFVCDWMVQQATVETQVLQARFKLYVGLSDDTANTYQSTIITQQLGIFVSMTFPKANASQVQLSLADDSLGQLTDVLLAPSLKDWITDAATTKVNSLFVDASLDRYEPYLIDPNVPTPLQFGKSPYNAAVVCTGPADGTVLADYDFDLTNWPAGQRKFLWPILVLATRSTAGVTDDDVGNLRGTFRNDVVSPLEARGRSIIIPQTFLRSDGVTTRIWKAYKTQTITINGFDWKLLWLAFNADAYDSWFPTQSQQIGLSGNFTGTTPVLWNWTGLGGTNHDSDEFAPMMQAFEGFEVGGSPGSGVYDGAGGLGTNGSACDIIRDFVEYYSQMGAGAWDATRFARADLVTNITVRGSVSAIPSMTSKAQITSTVSPYGVGVLRQALADLAATADLDVFLTMAGQVAVVHQGADFETATTNFPVFNESRIDAVEIRMPGQGDRWAPYNRVYIPKDGGQIGPYDNAAAVLAWGKIFPRTLAAKWWYGINNAPPPTAPPGGNVNNAVWSWRSLEAKARPIISFTTDLGILTLDLGDYFLLPWTRGGANALYPSTLWRLESASIILSGPNAGSVQVEAVWMQDLRTEYPYLLDDETLLVRAANGGATLTVTTGSTTVVRSAGSFITAGLVAGDVILMRDSSEAAAAFARNRQIKVVSITDATHAVVADSVFGAAGAHVIAAADWTMQRSFLTYPTVGTDPGNYPSGSLMYGKVSRLAAGVGQFSDGSLGNKLLDG